MKRKQEELWRRKNFRMPRKRDSLPAKPVRPKRSQSSNKHCSPAPNRGGRTRCPCQNWAWRRTIVQGRATGTVTSGSNVNNNAASKSKCPRLRHCKESSRRSARRQKKSPQDILNAARGMGRAVPPMCSFREIMARTTKYQECHMKK